MIFTLFDVQLNYLQVLPIQFLRVNTFFIIRIKEID
jgi:hypothetical protein